MQHTQHYFKATLLALLLAAPACAGTIARPTPPDPLLDGGDTAACAAGPVYAAGVDTTGNTVAPADVGAGRVPVPDQIAVPLAGATSRAGQGRRPINPATGASQGAYVTLDGRKLDTLVNPPPCNSAGH